MVLDFELDFLQTTLVGRQLSFGLRVRFEEPRRWRSISDVRPTRFQLHDVRLPPKRSATPTGNVFRCLLRLRYYVFDGCLERSAAREVPLGMGAPRPVRLAYSLITTGAVPVQIPPLGVLIVGIVLMRPPTGGGTRDW